MANQRRFATAISAIAVAAVLSGCAGPGTKTARTATGFGGKAGSNIGLALRADAALKAGDFATAVTLSESAVANSPDDAGYRSLLGNAYFAAGRFASAEAAYKDSLSLISNRPEVILKLVLATIAQGKNSEALSYLGAAQGALDASDYGLALALAGEPGQAVMVLETAARMVGADSKVRQNLALAYALSGDWEQARTIASQDLSPDMVDTRITQWMTFAKPARASDQVAALVGVTPAAADPGQPTRLALRRDDGTRVATAAPAAPAPAAPAAEQPAVQVAEAAPLPAPYNPAPPAVADAPKPEAAYVPPPAAPEVKPAVAPAPVEKAAPPMRAAAFVPKKAAKAPRAAGKSSAVVQLGAYRSRESVAVAWDQITKRYPGLKAFAPMTARFDGPKGTVYRLSVRGFDSQSEAISRCKLLKSKGGACFVRSVAGDAPVRIASR